MYAKFDNSIFSYSRHIIGNLKL